MLPFLQNAEIQGGIAAWGPQQQSREVKALHGEEEEGRMNCSGKAGWKLDLGACGIWPEIC